MNIEELVNNYFEGETNCEEERELRRFFSQGIVPGHLEIYRPLFAFLEEENRQYRTVATTVPKRKWTFRRSLLYSLSGIAAGVLLLIGIAGVNRHFNAPENYVIIDGKQYTDATLIRQQAQAALREVSFSEEDVFATLFNE